MLKHEVLDILNITEWVRFKEFIKSRPYTTIGLKDGRVVQEYDDHDVHEFLGVIRCEQLPSKEKSQKTGEPQEASKQTLDSNVAP